MSHCSSDAHQNCREEVLCLLAGAEILSSLAMLGMEGVETQVEHLFGFTVVQTFLDRVTLEIIQTLSLQLRNKKTVFSSSHNLLSQPLATIHGLNVQKSCADRTGRSEAHLEGPLHISECVSLNREERIIGTLCMLC